MRRPWHVIDVSWARIPPGVATTDFQHPSFCHSALGCDTKWNSSRKLLTRSVAIFSLKEKGTIIPGMIAWSKWGHNFCYRKENHSKKHWVFALKAYQTTIRLWYWVWYRYNGQFTSTSDYGQSSTQENRTINLFSNGGCICNVWPWFLLNLKHLFLKIKVYTLI